MAQDPRTAGPRPPFPRQQQVAPGNTATLNPRPDHGEESYRGSRRFAACAVVVTGGDSGIGRAVTIAFAREGADVLIAYLNEDVDARESAEWVEKAGRRAVLVAGDVSDESHCQKIIDIATKEFERIDVLIIPSTMPPEKAANFGANTPLGRPGQPVEVAPAYVFLACDSASYITGAVLPVTGGRPML